MFRGNLEKKMYLFEDRERVSISWVTLQKLSPKQECKNSVYRVRVGWGILVAGHHSPSSQDISRILIGGRIARTQPGTLIWDVGFASNGLTYPAVPKH